MIAFRCYSINGAPHPIPMTPRAPHSSLFTTGDPQLFGFKSWKEGHGLLVASRLGHRLFPFFTRLFVTKGSVWLGQEMLPAIGMKTG